MTVTRCPGCGYTLEDARTLMDHRLCKEYPFFDDEVDAEDEADTTPSAEADEHSNFGLM